MITKVYGFEKGTLPRKIKPMATLTTAPLGTYLPTNNLSHPIYIMKVYDPITGSESSQIDLREDISGYSAQQMSELEQVIQHILETNPDVSASSFLLEQINTWVDKTKKDLDEWEDMDERLEASKSLVSGLFS